MNLNGRRTIYTDYLNITMENIGAVIIDAFTVHEANRAEMEYLYKYERGDQPILYRKKTIRPEIDNHAVENHAAEIVSFKIGYEAGAPITFVQRANIDLAGNEQADDRRITAINEMMFEENKPAKDIQLFRDFKICGVGYMMALPKVKRNGISPFDLLVLNPLNTFVVKTNDAYRRTIMAVTYSVLRNGNKEITAYTDDFVYTLGIVRVEDEKAENGAYTKAERINRVPNILGVIPIVEFINNYDKTGAFEPVIPLMDALNVANSDRVNDVSQFVQSLLWLHNCEITAEDKEKIKDGGMIMTRSTGDGHDAKIVYLTSMLNQSETQTLVDYLYQQILQISGVPGREQSNGGNTGSAILLSNGWQLAETQAKAMELTYSKSIRELLGICLEIIKNTDGMDEELKTLSVSDALPKFSRNKTYDLVSRVNALVTLTNAGYDIKKSVALVDISDDPLQFAVDSAENVDKVRFTSDTAEDIKVEESIQPSAVGNVDR